MKKKIIIFVSIIIVVVLVASLGSFYLLKNDEEQGSISKVDEGIYKEIISVENKGVISGYTINDGVLYYLERKDITSEEGEYYLNSLNYQTGDKESHKLSDDKLLFCYLNKAIISCNNETRNNSYDLKLNKIYDESINEDYYEAYVPYNNTYWKFSNGVLKSGQEEIKIPSYDESFAYADYLVTKDNTYLLFMSSNEYYIYDIKENSLINTHERKYMKYDGGYSFYSSTHYHIYDLVNNEDNIYYVNGLIGANIEYFGSIHNNNIYQVSSDTNLVEIYNTKKDKVSSFDITGYVKYPITSVDYFKGALLITAFLDQELELIVINIDDMKLKEVSVYEYTVNQNKEIEGIVKRIKNKYNVNIKIKDEGEVQFFDFISQPLYVNGVIKTAITKVEKILNKFPEHFFEQFIHDNYKGLNIYISGNLTPRDLTTQASNPVAYSLMHEYSYTIVLDSFYSEFENTVCHELMHAMENNLNNKNKKIFTKWNSLNPSNFSYYENYNGYRYYEYTPHMTSNNKVYFVSNYSYTYAKEDRAEIFGKMCSEETNEDIKQYPNLYKKAQMIKEELIHNYPELNNSVFLENYK